MKPSDAPLVSPPAGRKRTLVNAAIAAFLVVQLVVPLDYYRRWNFGGNESDERFSWRFFSSVSLRRHKLFLREELHQDHPDASRIVPLRDLGRTKAVGTLIARRHPDIGERFLRWRAAHPAVRSVEFECRSTTPDGQELPPVHLILDAATGELRTPEDSP